MKTYQPAVDKAVEWLRSAIEQGRLAPGEPIPPVRELARTTSTSTATMQKAIGVLRTAGLIAGRQRCRPTVAGSHVFPPRTPVSDHPVPMPVTAVTRIHADLRRDILLGTFAAGMPLPSIKELRQRFGTSSRTINQVLARLGNDGLVSPFGRGYRVRLHGSRKASARVVCIGFTYGPDNAIIRAHHDDYVRNPLQTECWRRNLFLEYVGCPIDTCTELYGVDSRRKFTFDKNVIGCIFLFNQLPERAPEVLRMLAGLRMPVAIIDEFGTWNVQEFFPADGRVRVFAFTAGRSGARDIVRTLLNYGHRRFAFISPHKNQPWSQVRRDTILEELDGAGLRKNIEIVEFDTGEATKDLNPQASLKEVQDRIDRILSEYPQEIQGAYMRALNPLLWGAYLEQNVAGKRLRAILEPLCKRRDITAWIAVNDLTALFAHETLRKNGLNLPTDLSLVSFDNSANAQDTRIASYDFNGPALITSALDYIVANTDARAQFPAERVEISGMLIERASLGPAPDRQA